MMLLSTTEAVDNAALGMLRKLLRKGPPLPSEPPTPPPTPPQMLDVSMPQNFVIATLAGVVAAVVAVLWLVLTSKSSTRPAGRVAGRVEKKIVHTLTQAPSRTAVPAHDERTVAGDPWSDSWQSRNSDPVKARRPAWAVGPGQPRSLGPSPAAAWENSWLEANCDPLKAKSLRPAWDESDRGNKVHVFCDPRLIPQSSANAHSCDQPGRNPAMLQGATTSAVERLFTTERQFASKPMFVPSRLALTPSGLGGRPGPSSSDKWLEPWFARNCDSLRTPALRPTFSWSPTKLN